MRNIFRRNLNKIVTLLLRTATVLYLLSVVYPFLVEPGFENNFGNWALRWGLIIALALAAMGMFILKRADFLLYGFFIVFIAAFYQLFSTLLSKSPFPDLLVHLYVIATAIYFVTKDLRNTQSHHHHRNSKNGNQI